MRAVSEVLEQRGGGYVCVLCPLVVHCSFSFTPVFYIDCEEAEWRRTYSEVAFFVIVVEEGDAKSLCVIGADKLNEQQTKQLIIVIIITTADLCIPEDIHTREKKRTVTEREREEVEKERWRRISKGQR